MKPLASQVFCIAHRYRPPSPSQPAATRKQEPPPPPPPPSPTSPAPTATITVTPSSINPGGSAVLAWRTTDATDVSIEGLGRR